MSISIAAGNKYKGDLGDAMIAVMGRMFALSAYTVWGLIISLLPPFYPREAELRGATPAQYGFVFGAANLAAFVAAPLFGRFGGKIGAKLLYNLGAYLQALCAISLGLLYYAEDVNVFIGLSYMLR